MSALFFLLMRALHVVSAAIWFGSAFFISMLLAPTLAASGPSGGQVMSNLVRRGLPAFMAGVSGSTVLTGFWLYWRFTGGFDPVVSATRGGMAFGIGGIAGLTAMLVGLFGVGRNVKQIVDLMGRAMQVPEGAERGALLARAEGLRRTVGVASRIALVLIAVATVLMTVGHYI
ncbi:MAG: hypothetical protein AB7Q29_10065 [Vicinamibacterales bacterium]